MMQAANAHSAPIIALDIPSGVDADTGGVGEIAIQAIRTVTFFRKKTGHVLFPGRALCGSVDVIDIGVAESVLGEIQPRTVENHPQAWGAAFPRPNFQTHKYSRGATAVFTGPQLATGAARLSAMAALRAGSGLVALVSPASAAVETPITPRR